MRVCQKYHLFTLFLFLEFKFSSKLQVYFLGSSRHYRPPPPDVLRPPGPTLEASQLTPPFPSSAPRAHRWCNYCRPLELSKTGPQGFWACLGLSVPALEDRPCRLLRKHSRSWPPQSLETSSGPPLSFLPACHLRSAPLFSLPGVCPSAVGALASMTTTRDKEPEGQETSIGSGVGREREDSKISSLTFLL